jgi:hypothetical protein
MKKKLIFLIPFYLIFFCLNGKAQGYSDGFTGSLGVVQEGIAAQLSYNYFLDRHDFIEGSIFITASNYKYRNIKIPYNDFTVNFGYSKNVFYNYRNTFNINVNGGALFGYENFNKGDKSLSNGALILNKPGFIYGAYMGVDFDFSVSDNMSIILKANQFYHANSSLGQFLPYVGIGTRFYFN